MLTPPLRSVWRPSSFWPVIARRKLSIQGRPSWDRWAYEQGRSNGDLRQAIAVVVVEINDKEITTRVNSRGKIPPNNGLRS